MHKNNNRLHYQRPASTLPPTKTSKHLQFTRHSDFNDCVMHILRKPLSCSDNSKSGIDNIHSLRGAQASVSVYDALSEKSGLLTSGKCPLLNTQLSQMIWLRSRILLQHWTHCKLKHHRLIWTLYVVLLVKLKIQASFLLSNYQHRHHDDLRWPIRDGPVRRMEEGLLIQHTTSFQRRAGWASLEGEVICWDECKKTILIFVLPLQDPSNKTLVMMTLATFIKRSMRCL